MGSSEIVNLDWSTVEDTDALKSKICSNSSDGLPQTEECEFDQILEKSPHYQDLESDFEENNESGESNSEFAGSFAGSQRE